jgi:hypothetical protein
MLLISPYYSSMYSAIEDIIINSIQEWYQSTSFEGNIKAFETSLSNKCGFNILHTYISWINNKTFIRIEVDTCKTPTYFTVCVDSENILDIGEYLID